MNLRKRYKKAKQKIALLEKQTVRNIELIKDEPIKKCACKIMVEPWKIEHPEIIMEEIGQKLMKEVADCIRVENTLDEYTGKVVIRASLRVIGES